MLGTIYALATPEGEIRYCGKTVKPPSHRLHGHKDSAYRNRGRHVNYWLRSIYDAGKEPKVMVCETVDLTGLDRTEQMAKLNEAERRWIMQLRALGFRLTNATTGGDGGHGRVASSETRRKMSAAQTGKKRSPEACANIKAARALQPKETHRRGASHPHFGKSRVWRDPAARVAKILEAKAAWSGDQRAKASSHLRGNKFAKRKLSDDQVVEIRASSLSQSKLSEIHGVSQSTISFIKAGKRRPLQEKI